MGKASYAIEMSDSGDLEKNVIALFGAFPYGGGALKAHMSGLAKGLGVIEEKSGFIAAGSSLMERCNQPGPTVDGVTYTVTANVDATRILLHVRGVKGSVTLFKSTVTFKA